MIYLPEIKYRRVLNKAFGPGGWGLAPRSETNVGPKIVSREYALVCLGRYASFPLLTLLPRLTSCGHVHGQYSLVAIARGEQEYFDPSGIPTATEACKSNALMRCCKDLGVASELWDPRFIREFKAKYCVEVFAEHLPTKKKCVHITHPLPLSLPSSSGPHLWDVPWSECVTDQYGCITRRKMWRRKDQPKFSYPFQE